MDIKNLKEIREQKGWTRKNSARVSHYSKETTGAVHKKQFLPNLPTSENTIFSKMGVDYDEFRLSENQIDTVRNYYKNKKPSMT